MVLLFVTMFIKRIDTFQGMAAYASVHDSRFGFPPAPSRHTMRRRFDCLPRLLQHFMPFVAEHLSDLDEHFRFKFGFIDTCLFWAKGGVWHKKHVKQGIVPNKHIDTDASWGKSIYQGWVFGDGLHPAGVPVIVNQFRFPISASVSTGQTKAYTQIENRREK